MPQRFNSPEKRLAPSKAHRNWEKSRHNGDIPVEQDQGSEPNVTPFANFAARMVTCYLHKWLQVCPDLLLVVTANLDGNVFLESQPSNGTRRDSSKKGGKGKAAAGERMALQAIADTQEKRTSTAKYQVLIQGQKVASKMLVEKIDRRRGLKKVLKDKSMAKKKAGKAKKVGSAGEDTSFSPSPPLGLFLQRLNRRIIVSWNVFPIFVDYKVMEPTRCIDDLGYGRKLGAINVFSEDASLCSK